MSDKDTAKEVLKVLKELFHAGTRSFTLHNWHTYIIDDRKVREIKKRYKKFI